MPRCTFSYDRFIVCVWLLVANVIRPAGFPWEGTLVVRI